MPTVRTGALQALLTKRQLSQSEFEERLKAAGVAHGTALVIARETRSSTIEITDDVAISLTRAIQMSEDDLEAFGVLPSDDPVVLNPAVSLVVLVIALVAGYFYWSAQRREPNQVALGSVETKIDQACASATNLPEWFACRELVLRSAKDEWLPEWAATAAQDQALWSFTGLIVSIFGLGVTATGVYYVAQTLAATRRAARAADRAAIAALDANEGFRISAERQLRPYMTFDGIKAARVRGAFTDYQAVWENTGQTPARTVRRGSGFWNDSTLPPSNYDFPDKIARDLQSPLGGVGAGDQLFIDGPIVTSGEMSEIGAGRRFLLFWSWVEYDDGFEGTPVRRTEYCAQFIVETTSDGVLATRWTPFGPFNGIDETCFRKPQAKAET